VGEEGRGGGSDDKTRAHRHERRKGGKNWASGYKVKKLKLGGRGGERGRPSFLDIYAGNSEWALLTASAAM